MGEQLAPSTYVPSSSLTPLTVSWQTAFWTLTPLATNIITQPSGRVLSLHSRYRTYLRSSPIICALDAASFLLRIVCLPFLLRVSFRSAFDIVVLEKFLGSDGKDEKDEEAEDEEAEADIKSVQNQTWLRWVFFAVGALGPAIKLAGLEGIPWTKAWGLMFFSSWVVSETMIFAHRKDYTSCIPIQELPPEKRVLEIFRKFDSRVLFLGISLHVGLLVWAVISCWALRCSYYDDIWVGPEGRLGGQKMFVSGPLTPPLIAMLASAFLFNGAITLPIFYFIGRWALKNWRQLLTIWLTDFIPCCVCVFTPCGLMVGAIIGAMQLPLATYLIDVPILFAVIWGVPLLMLGISWLCGKFPSLGEKLLLRPSRSGIFKVSLSDLANLMFFLVNLVLCLAWYSLKYNSHGTVNPGWTGIFG